MFITWTNNKGSVLNSRETGNTTTIVIENPQPSNNGIYQCVFDDIGFDGGSGWILTRNIVLSVTGMFVHEATYKLLCDHIMKCMKYPFLI